MTHFNEGDDLVVVYHDVSYTVRWLSYGIGKNILNRLIPDRHNLGGLQMAAMKKAYMAVSRHITASRRSKSIVIQGTWWVFLLKS